MTQGERTFNKVTKNKYQNPVAVVYGTDRGVPFRRTFKRMEKAVACAKRFNGIIFPL